MNVTFSAQVEIKSSVGINTKQRNKKSCAGQATPGAGIPKRKNTRGSLLFQSEKRRQLRISDEIFEEGNGNGGQGLAFNMLVSPSNPDALSRRLLAKLQEDRSGKLDSCIDQIDGNTPQADMEKHDGLGTSSEKAEEEEKENTVAVAVMASATDTAAVTELSNNYLRELWEWADNFRIDSARWGKNRYKG